MKNKKKRPPILNIIREVTDYDFAMILEEKSK